MILRFAIVTVVIQFGAVCYIKQQLIANGRRQYCISDSDSRRRSNEDKNIATEYKF